MRIPGSVDLQRGSIGSSLTPVESVESCGISSSARSSSSDARTVALR